MRMFSFDRAARAGLLAAACLPWPAHATVKDGVDAWQAGNFTKALGEWRGPAAAGDPDAQFNLGQAYKLGRGVPVDFAMAQSLYQKAAAQGHEQAQANLGLILFQNGDRKAALPWLQKAAARGEPRAQYVVGTAHFNGDLAAKDWPRAYAMMTRAAAAGLPQASRSLIEMDRYVPLGQRQQGLALARDMADAEAAASAAELQMAAAAPSAAPAVRAVPLPAARAAARPMLAQAAPAAPKPMVPPRPRSLAPRPVAATVPAPTVAGAGGWRVQLGAFGTPGAAQAAWTSFAGLSGFSGLRPMLVKAGAITRLQAGPLPSKAAAARACSTATAAGRGCFPVAP